MAKLTFGDDYLCPKCRGSGLALKDELQCPVCRGTGIKSNPEEPRFGGDTYDPERDRSRLQTVLHRVQAMMSDGEWWTIEQLADRAGCTEASASARIRDLRKPKFGGYTVERQNRGGGRWEYRLIVPPAQQEKDR